VTRIIPEEGVRLLRDASELRIWEGETPPPREVLLQEVREIEGLLALLTDEIDEALLEAAPRLRVISNYAVGYDNIDVGAATARKILVCNTPGVLTETTADLAFALLMASARRLVPADAYTRAGKWKTWEPMLFLGEDIHHAALGIVGLGRIGVEMARRGRGFSMRLLYFDLQRRMELEQELGVEYRPLDDLLRESDFVSLHIPLSEKTHHLIGARELGLMKRRAILVNTSRGPVVDEQALVEALRKKQIAGAGLDVFEVEPLPRDHPLLALENVTLVPHIGSASSATRARMAMMAAQNLLAALGGERPAHLVNPAALD
jgi:glyoxylate reductase